MILAIDAGNSRVKWGWHDGRQWANLATVSLIEFAAASHDINPFAATHEEPERIVISNVAGDGAHELLVNWTSIFEAEPLWLRGEAERCGVRNGYEEPERLGSDRWAALIAARAVHGGPGLVVNAGTATTADMLSAEGEFLGGIILPGVELMRFVLHDHTGDAARIWNDHPTARQLQQRLDRFPGIGQKTASQVLDNLTQVEDVMMALRESRMPSAAMEGWRDFLELVQSLHLRIVPWTVEFETVCKWYATHLERLYEDAPIRQLDIDQLQKIAATYPGRQRFLTELTLDPPDATSDESGAPLLDEDYLILSTIHSAKGQEWNAVHLLNAVDGCMPSDLATGNAAEIEEERRLLYVAMTRAKEHLQIVVPQRFYVTQQSQYGDRHVYAGRTRFIPPGIADKFEMRAWPAAETAPAGTKSREEVVDLLAKMKEMWR